ncbi:thiamine pyrophosphate-binding protein [Actinomadura opuntiae]|uniref:thiamine pyrophosphate-binding protein n=1 Tax=Actinomadura sp. OS1-43 TaxID=604315 RepID=UPI00255A7470|nr:thiamine pyrophosphate-binding protein [Actinomadura sp. OS1-43]MDL4814137.1 thiamine pyrophosphate-binding protein [Actinomadura sp. OS1-43]
MAVDAQHRDRRTGGAATVTAAGDLVRPRDPFGVEDVFGTCGHTNIALLDALGRSPIEFVIARHEQAAAHAADGYVHCHGRHPHREVNRHADPGRLLIYLGGGPREGTGREALLSLAEHLHHGVRARCRSRRPEPEFRWLRRDSRRRRIRHPHARSLGSALRSAVARRRPDLVEAPVVNEPVPTPGRWNTNDIYQGVFPQEGTS